MTNNAEIRPGGFNLYALRHFSIDREWEIWPFLGRFFKPNGRSDIVVGEHALDKRIVLGGYVFLGPVILSPSQE